MPRNATPDVPAFLDALQHARKPEVEAVRALVLGARDGITERVKWNAPSFCVGGDDRVTMRLQPKDVVQLVFHRGAKAKDPAGFEFPDDTGLMAWQAPDRAVVTFADMADVEAKRDRVAGLVKRWMDATS